MTTKAEAILTVATAFGIPTYYVYQCRHGDGNVSGALRKFGYSPADYDEDDLKDAESLYQHRKSGGTSPPVPTRSPHRGSSMPKLEVTRKQAVKLLEQLGYQNARTMSISALTIALKKLDETADDAAQAKVKDEDSQELLKKLLVSVTAGTDVEVLSGKKEEPKKPETKTTAPVTDEEEDDDEEDGEDDDDESAEDDADEDDDSEPVKPAKAPAKKKPVKKAQMTHVPAPKPAKAEKPSKKAPAKPATASKDKKQAKSPVKAPKASGAKPEAATSKPKKPEQKASKPKKKASGPKMPRNGKGGRPGVYAVIVEVLQKASKTKPVTEDGILKVLKQKIKDKKPEGMMTTLKDALRRTLNARYNLEPQTNNKGGWWLPS